MSIVYCAASYELKANPSTSSQSVNFQFYTCSGRVHGHHACMPTGILRDSPKARKLITNRISGSSSHTTAKYMASIVAHSVLFKSGVLHCKLTWGDALVALFLAIYTIREGRLSQPHGIICGLEFMQGAGLCNMIDDSVAVTGLQI